MVQENYYIWYNAIIEKLWTPVKLIMDYFKVKNKYQHLGVLKNAVISLENS